MRNGFLLIFMVFTGHCFSQYEFTGQADGQLEGRTAYLSLIEDYRKMARVSFDQIIGKSQIDSLGRFGFEGNHLPQDNRIYRIHIDECTDTLQNSGHFFGRCENSKGILFIANNRDTISFPKSFDGQTLCEVISTNDKSSALLEIDGLKEEMAFDFYDVHSEANRKLNSKKWFSTLQQFGQNVDEPLAELYIYDFLSDRRNETYSYYLEDIGKNDYYEGLGDRLGEKYPESDFTRLYQTEIATDLQIVSHQSASKGNRNWIWALVLLGCSMLLNIYFLIKQKRQRAERKDTVLQKLTPQEQKIVDEILKDKTNKEIASELFISLSTVKTHINNLYKKLNVTSREEIKSLLNR